MDGQSIEDVTNEYYDTAETLKATQAQSKPRPTLIPMHALEVVAETLTTNAAKHGDYTWRDCDPVLYNDALWRHMIKLGKGEALDEDGTPHMAAIACNALILLEKELT